MRAPDRFHSLDVLRGIAALSVVLCHWRMWTLDDRGRLPSSFSPDMLPLSPLMAFFDGCGKYAVGLFFSLSGFVFYWLYREAIREGRVGAREFAVGRFSRLYPLQLATLLLVAAMQAVYMRINGGVGFAFVVNDLPDFVKHLFLVPLWSGNRNYTFNGPDWSLAVEAFLYVCFFLAACRFRLGATTTVALVGIGAAFDHVAPDLSWGVVSFFVGGLAYVVFERLEHGVVAERVLRTFLVLAWPLTFACGSHAIEIDATPFWWVGLWFSTYLLFPATLLYLALLETRRGPLGARMAWLGDISYSSYLLHFPLMLAVALLLRATGLGFGFMLTPVGLAGFFILLVLASSASFRFFERPVQEVIRHRAMSRPRAEPVHRRHAVIGRGALH